MKLIPWLNILYIELKIKCLNFLLFFLMLSSHYNSYALFTFIWEQLKAPISVHKHRIQKRIIRLLYPE